MVNLSSLEDETRCPVCLGALVMHAMYLFECVALASHVGCMSPYPAIKSLGEGSMHAS